MSKRLRPRITFANVVSCLALFVALGSGAYAAKQLPKNSVGTKQIRKNAVKTGDIARNAVKVGKLDKEAVKAAKLAKNAVPTNRLRNNAVTGAKVNEATLDTVPTANAASTANIANSLAPAEGWHEVGAPGEPGFENLFKNVGEGYSTAAFFKDHEGVVHLKGALFVGVPDTAAFTLPPGYRPSQKTLGPAAHVITKDASIQITPGGEVEIHTGESSAAGLDGFTFRAET
ncbi:MAG TPA: hypothetical protein VFZ41_06205 [Solirubrobacterales bacterium]